MDIEDKLRELVMVVWVCETLSRECTSWCSGRLEYWRFCKKLGEVKDDLDGGHCKRYEEISLREHIVFNRREWRQRIHDDTIRDNILTHATDSFFMGLRLYGN